MTQAILPLRGKILNVAKAREEQLFKNEEISNLIIALGLGDKGAPLEKVRHHKKKRKIKDKKRAGEWRK